jgi:hypothetical protein
LAPAVTAEVTGRPGQNDPDLTIGKGGGGGKFEQRSGDDDPGRKQQRHYQGISDDPILGILCQFQPEPGYTPGKLFGKQGDEQQKAGIEKYCSDHVIPGSPGWRNRA